MGGGVGNGRDRKFCMPLCVYINLIHTFMCENHKSGVDYFFFFFKFIGERAKRARHSQVCSIENRIYRRVR